MEGTSSKITKLFTAQKFILTLNGNFFHFSELKLSLSRHEISDFTNTIYFLNFRSHGKKSCYLWAFVKLMQVKWRDTYFNCFCSVLIPLSHYQQGSSLMRPGLSGKFLVLKFSCFLNLSCKRKSHIDFERQNMSLFFSLMPNFYMADWILFKFSKRKKKERERNTLILDQKPVMENFILKG